MTVDALFVYILNLFSNYEIQRGSLRMNSKTDTPVAYAVTVPNSIPLPPMFTLRQTGTMHGIDLGANCDRAGTSLSFFPNPPLALEFSSRVSIDLDSCVAAKNLLRSVVKIGLFRTCLPMLFLCNCMI